MSGKEFASHIIPEEVVEAAWVKIGSMSDNEARLHMQRLSRKQPALLAFVTALSEDLSQNGSESAIYMFVTIVEMFETHFGKRLRNVGPKRVDSAHEVNARILEGMAGASEKPFEQAAIAQSENQPWVWRYVLEYMFETDDESPAQSEEDQGTLALIMKTVIDALDSSVA